MVSTGFSAVIGSWKTMAMSLPRSRRIARSETLPTSWPLTTTWPLMRAFLGSSRIAVMAVTDLPEPDSPTTATTSPGRTSRVTPLTACTEPNSVLNRTSTSAKDRTAPVSLVTRGDLGGGGGHQSALLF